jgi:D-inositol-3-phosphate glycosyltransferase
MRIAMVSVDVRPVGAYHRDTPTGPAVHVTELAAGLAALGHDVRIYARRCSPTQPDQVRTDTGVTVVNAPIGDPRLLLPQEQLSVPNPFGRWLAETWQDGWSPDVVHGHGWPGGVAALTARGVRHRPTTVTLHGIGSADQLRSPGTTTATFRCALERAIGTAADSVVALSRAEAHTLGRLGVPLQRLTVVPSGVDSEHFGPTGPSWARKPDTHRVLAVGALAEHSGFADVVGALDDLPDTEVVILGRPAPPSRGLGPEAARLRAIAVNSRVHQRLRLAGGVPYGDMPGWYRSADVLVCAPWCTPFSRAAVEAMACGVPVVAVAVGGLRDTVLDGVTGQLIPPLRPSSLAQVVGGLLADAPRRRRYGAAGVQRARSLYAWSAVAQSVAEVYERIRRFARTTLVVPSVSPRSVSPHTSVAAA